MLTRKKPLEKTISSGLHSDQLDLKPNCLFRLAASNITDAVVADFAVAGCDVANIAFAFRRGCGCGLGQTASSGYTAVRTASTLTADITLAITSITEAVDART